MATGSEVFKMLLGGIDIEKSLLFTLRSTLFYPAIIAEYVDDGIKTISISVTSILRPLIFKKISNILVGLEMRTLILQYNKYYNFDIYNSSYFLITALS